MKLVYTISELQVLRHERKISPFMIPLFLQVCLCGKPVDEWWRPTFASATLRQRTQDHNALTKRGWESYAALKSYAACKSVPPDCELVRIEPGAPVPGNAIPVIIEDFDEPGTDYASDWKREVYENYVNKQTISHISTQLASESSFKYAQFFEPYMSVAAETAGYSAYLATEIATHPSSADPDCAAESLTECSTDSSNIQIQISQ